MPTFYGFDFPSVKVHLSTACIIAIVNSLLVCCFAGLAYAYYRRRMKRYSAAHRSKSGAFLATLSHPAYSSSHLDLFLAGKPPSSGSPKASDEPKHPTQYPTLPAPVVHSRFSFSRHRRGFSGVVCSPMSGDWDGTNVFGPRFKALPVEEAIKAKAELLAPHGYKLPKSCFAGLQVKSSTSLKPLVLARKAADLPGSQSAPASGQPSISLLGSTTSLFNILAQKIHPAAARPGETNYAKSDFKLSNSLSRNIPKSISRPVLKSSTAIFMSPSVPLVNAGFIASISGALSRFSSSASIDNLTQAFSRIKVSPSRSVMAMIRKEERRLDTVALAV